MINIVLLKLILDVVYLIRNFDSNRLGSSFWLFTSSITLDLLSLCSYLLLIREYENEFKSISLNKKLEDFRKSGMGSMTSAGSQTQIHLPFNLNKDLPEKKIVNYQNQGLSFASIASKSFDNTEKDNSYINYINIKNAQDSQNSISYNDIPLQTIFPNGNSSNDNKLQNDSYRQSMGSNPSSSMINNIDNSSPQTQNKKINIFKKGSPKDNNDQINNPTTSNEGEHVQDNSKISQIGIAKISSTENERNKDNSKNKQPESSTDQNIKCTVRPKRDSSLIMNSSFSNMNNLPIPVKSSSENKIVSSSSYSLNVLPEEDISKSQTLETSKTQTQDSYLNQSSTLVNNSDTNNSLEPIYSNELESLHDIESFEDYPAINRINQANSIPTTHSSSTPSQPKSQPPLQQHSQLPKPPLSQRPQSYQQFNSVPYTASSGSKQSSTTIDDYVPLPSHNINTPSSSQIARKSQRDSLLNQIFGTTNDNKTFVSLTALTDENSRRETYQSFDQLPLENHHGLENSSFTKVTNEVSNEMPNESFSQTLCHDSFSQSYYLSHSNPDAADNSLLEGLSYTQDITNTNVKKSHSTHNTPTQVLPEKDFSGHSMTKSNHTSSILDKSANINKYSAKSLQLKNVPLNDLDPNINERINSITVNKYVNEENNDPSKETNFDILASTSIISEKELYQEPSYYGNSSFFDDKMPFYDRVNEYNERMKEKGSIVSSLSISSSSTSSIQNSSSSSSINDHYKNHPEEEMTEHTRRNMSKNYHQDTHLSEAPVEDEYEMNYYETHKYFEPESELEPEESRRHSKSYSHQSSTFDPNQVSIDQDDPLVHHGIEKGSDHHYNNSQTYVELHNGNLYENEEEEEEEQEDGDDENVNKLQHYRNELERRHHPMSSSSEEEEEEEEEEVEEEMEGSHMPNINYEREENDYENQKPPVTVVTIPPLSPFELPAIAIPFNQPDPREVGTFSPIVTTQPTLTTKPISYTLNNHLSIPYDRSYLNDFSYNNNNNNNNMFNEQMRYTKKSHSTTSLNADDLYSPHYYPRNSQPYPSGHSSRHSHSSQQQHYPHNDLPYTNQLFQHRQKSNITRRSIHSNASNSNSSAHLKNKTYADNSVVGNSGNISIHSNSNTNDINTNSNKTNITNSQSFYYYVCKQKFKPQNENEIEMNVGDIIQIYRILDEGWCYGKNRTTNCVGIIPQAFLATMLTPKDKGTPDPYVIELMEKEIEKLKDRKKMIIYLERRLQDPNLSETDREMYQQHLDYAYLTLESPSSLSIHY